MRNAGTLEGLARARCGLAVLVPLLAFILTLFNSNSAADRGQSPIKASIYAKKFLLINTFYMIYLNFTKKAVL